MDNGWKVIMGEISVNDGKRAVKKREKISPLPKIKD
jgi:hypothetical protein